MGTKHQWWDNYISKNYLLPWGKFLCLCLLLFFHLVKSCASYILFLEEINPNRLEEPLRSECEPSTSTTVSLEKMLPPKKDHGQEVSQRIL